MRHRSIGRTVLVTITMLVLAPSDYAEPAKPPTNLQVLPASLSQFELRDLMKQYERDLGVSCNYCHVEDRDSGVIDYATDDNPRKHTARIMIAMLDDINGTHLTQLGGDRRYAAAVTCGSCHQGRANPQAFAP
jgi:hypothetical protein